MKKATKISKNIDRTSTKIGIINDLKDIFIRNRKSVNLLEKIASALTEDITSSKGKYLKIFIKKKLYNIRTIRVTK